MSCILLANNRLMDITQLALTLVRWPNCENLGRLACKFDLEQSEHKSLQVHARPGQTKSQVDLSFQIACTCRSIRPGLYFRNVATFSICNYGSPFCHVISVQWNPTLRSPH